MDSTDPSAWSLVSVLRCLFSYWCLKTQISALVHDLAESLVGDITPYCGISREDKKEREMVAMHDLAKLIEPKGERLLKLFIVSV